MTTPQNATITAKGIPPWNNAKLIEKNQCVGDGFGLCHLRDLWEMENGERYSVQKTHWEVSEKPSDRPIKWRFLP